MNRIQFWWMLKTNKFKNCYCLKSVFLLSMVLAFCSSSPVCAEETGESTILVAEQAQEKIQMDGIANEPVWEKAKRLIIDVQDGVIGDINVEMQAAYDRERIYFFARWPDSTKDVLKKAWVYDAKAKRWVHKLKDRKLYGKSNRPRRKDRG